MSANLAVLTRLSRIAGEPASDVARAAATCALVDAYTRGLYDRLGIVMTHRPTIRAKQDAKDELDAVRLMVFRAELGAADGVAHVFATARQRIEMARRALDLRIVDEERRREGNAGPSPETRDDRTFIHAVRERLRDKRAVGASWEAIRQSRELLARFGAPARR
jgi:hypothetical protein